MTQKTIETSKFITCNSLFTNHYYINKVIPGVVNFNTHRQKDDLYSKFINWTPSKNDRIVFTLYAPKDIDLPMHYEVIFKLDSPTEFIIIDFSITIAILNGWTFVDQISRGHKHICILHFKDKAPSILDQLPIFDENKWLPDTLGFCNIADFDMIKSNLLSQKVTQGERTTGVLR